MDIEKSMNISREIKSLQEKLDVRIHKNGKVYSAISRQERLEIGERILKLYKQQQELLA